MVIDLINRLLVLLFVLSILNVIRHLFFVIQRWWIADTETERYTLPKISILLLGVSLAYIITSLFTGIYL